jgi:hypothetical protein
MNDDKIIDLNSPEFAADQQLITLIKQLLQLAQQRELTALAFVGLNVTGQVQIGAHINNPQQCVALSCGAAQLHAVLQNQIFNPPKQSSIIPARFS